MQPVDGVVQHYAWGDHDFIPRLLGTEPDGRPWAELWLGTHPNGPTTIAGRPLAEITGPLPYLLKVLAAAEPLSLQAHPTREQAIAGFAAGRYPDDQPKPELLMALTPFSALCGVRSIDATLALLAEHRGDRVGNDRRTGRGRRGDARPLPRSDRDRADHRERVTAHGGRRRRWCARWPPVTPVMPASP